MEGPGIVSVYGLGAYGDGRPYYAMRFIRGDSLKQAIAHFHADPYLKDDPSARSRALRKLLRRFTDVCNAIDQAHTRGVLHRDVKPGNVIVGKHGETLVVDRGLAKADPTASTDERPLTPYSAGGNAETLTNSAFGIPASMSPEQVRGDLAAFGPILWRHFSVQTVTVDSKVGEIQRKTAQANLVDGLTRIDACRVCPI